MISVKVNGNGFVVSGEFDFGYIGIYKDDQISLSGKIEEVRKWSAVHLKNAALKNLPNF